MSATSLDIPESITVRRYAELRGVGLDTVLHWIATGQLRAVNVAKNPNGLRPRWRIAADAIEAFEAARQVSPKAPAPRRRKRPSRPVGFVQFFEE